MEKKTKDSVTTEWIKINNVKNCCFVGNDAIAFNLVSHILFTSLNTGKESFYQADEDNGDGVACMAGHKVFPIFAFTENCWCPRIFIVSYPEFTRISALESKDENIYISLAFSETEHLIALTGMPSYNIQVWYWRTQDMLLSQETGILTDKQKITCSSSLPLTVAQFAYKRGELIVWEVHGTQKFCKLIKRKISLGFDKSDGPFQDVYSIEGNIQIVNAHGDVYYVIPSSGSVNVISKWNDGVGGFDSCIAYVRNGILVSGPTGTLKYLKRQKYVWNEIFQTTPPESTFVMMKGYHDDSVVGTTISGGIFKMTLSDNDKISFTKIKNYDDSYDFFEMINPVSDYLVAVTASNEIVIISHLDGSIAATIPIANQTVLQSNPLFPFIAVGTTTGDVICVSLFDAANPKTLTEFMLSRWRTQKMHFSDKGSFLVVVDTENNFFIIKCIPGDKMVILHHFKESSEMTNFCVVESWNRLDILILSQEGKLLRHCIQLDEIENSQRHEMDLPLKFGRLSPYPDSSNKFYGYRSGTKNIEVIEISEESATVTSAIVTCHKISHFEGHRSNNHLITWSLDGMVVIYDIKKNHEILASFMSSNRFEYGIKIARCNASAEFVVTLDQEGNLVCTKLNATKVSTELEELLQQAQEKCSEHFSRTTSGGFPGLSGEYSGKKFTDLKSEQTYQMEARDSEETRKQLFNKLDELRAQVKKMLDENEKFGADEKLLIHDFNLDLVTTAQKEQKAREDRNQEEKKMMDYIDAQTAMNNWTIAKCWDPMEVKGARLRGMFISLFIENYALLKNQDDNQLKRIRLIRAIENSVARQDSFLPWKPIPTIELEKILMKEPGMFELNTHDDSQFAKIHCTLMGTSTFELLQISPLHYQQLDVVSFHQMKIEKYLIMRELKELKKMFNKKFNSMHTTKEYQIHSIRFKNDRLRHIQTETRILDELRGLRLESLPQILDPDFMPDEIPDTVINVVESEVCVAPYISPSYKKMLEEQEAARERRRRELEADDFRDKALEVMMDGVLEHKWEDEIKKNPKEPDCLIKRKAREDWTELEMRDVEEYTQKLKHVQGERDKYRRQLYEEQKLLQELLDEEIHQFNYGLSLLSMEKLKVDMVVEQEEMKLLLITNYNFRRISYQRKEIELRHKMESVKSLIEQLVHLQTDLQDWIKDIKNNYENLQVKDKTLEKQFKANFNESCPGAPVDQAFKYFKRRPKLQMRAQITSPILLEVAKRVASKKLSHQIKLLPSECIEVLNGVDNLDQVASSTTGIDANSWNILCKMRRIKIESEFKIKSLGLQLADAEATLTAFTKEIMNKRNYFQSIERSLVELKENRENDSINRYVQLVMQRGLIEIALTGSFTDFNDSILIHRSDISDINQIIVKAGMRKLRALENAAIFRRKITIGEWEHKVLKLKVRDLREFVKTIEKCKITKEVQMWLKRKERNFSEDLSEESLNKHIENSINAQEKVLSDIMQEISSFEKRIEKKKKETKDLDDQIQQLNIDVSEQNLMRNVEFERDEIRSAKERMTIITERAKLVRLIQHQHSVLLQLTTLLELQRLKTYPTLTQAHGSKFQSN